MLYKQGPKILASRVDDHPMTLLAANHLAAASTEGTGLICTILLFATVVALIFGLVQVLGLDGGRINTVGGRFGGLVVFVLLLLAYILFC